MFIRGYVRSIEGDKVLVNYDCLSRSEELVLIGRLFGPAEAQDASWREDGAVIGVHYRPSYREPLAWYPSEIVCDFVILDVYYLRA